MATKQNTKSATNEIQNLFDPQGYQNVLRTFASRNERMTQVVVDAGIRSTDLFSEAAKEALANMREVSQVRDEPTAYGQAYSDFVQKQMDLFMRTARSFSSVTQAAVQQTAEKASEVGDEFADKATTNAESAANRADSTAAKAA